MPETHPPGDIATLSIDEIARIAADRRLPPVDGWQPERSGDSGMRIARDGTWFHEGAPIQRPAMVRLFSTILRREADGSHVLVTPVEKLTIAVEDTPFLAVEMTSEGEGRDRRLAFRLNTDELVAADADHPLTMVAADGDQDGADGEHLHLRVRGGLAARIVRPVWYTLAELAIDEGAEPPGLWSSGVFFPFTRAR